MQTPPELRRGFLLYRAGYSRPLRDRDGFFETRWLDTRGRAGPRERRSAHGRFHEPGGVGRYTADGLRDVLQPDTQHAVDQRGDVRQQTRRARRADRLR